MMMLSNSSILPNPKYCEKNRDNDPLCSVKTQQEFLLKIYLKNRFPDLMLIFTTFVHDREQSLNEIKIALLHLYDLLKETASSTSKVIFFPTAPMVLSKIPEEEVAASFVNGIDGNRKINASNHILFETLLEQISSDRDNMYGFLDLYAMATGIQQAWSLDHVHFNEHYYKTTMAYLMQILNND